MNKSFTFFVVSLLMFGIVAVAFVAADDVSFNGAGSARTGNRIASAGANANLGPSGGEGEGVNSPMSPGAIVRLHKSAEYEGGDGSKVSVNRQIQMQNGSTIVSVQRVVTYSNGTVATYNVSIQSNNRTKERSMEMEKEGQHYNVSVEDGLNVSDRFFGNNSQLTANLSDGHAVNITVLPDQALKRVRDHLRLHNLSINGTNITLQESVHNKIPMVVYQVQVNQNGKFLGIFKMAMKTNTEVDAENGTVVAVNKPWWAFFVAVPSSSSPSQNQTANVTSNETVNATVNGTSSGVMIPANLTNSTLTNSTNVTNSS